jgi:hypothetical protein
MRCVYEASEFTSAVFSSSSFRYITGAKVIAAVAVGKVRADIYSPATIEKLIMISLYGVHGCRTLFTIMGTGCKTVSRHLLLILNFVTGYGRYRIGTMRGIRSGKSGYGGVVYGEKEIKTLGSYAGYNPLLVEIVRFFTTGKLPVTPEETLEIFTFMAAAEESKFKKGVPVETEKVRRKHKRMQQRLFQLVEM